MPIKPSIFTNGQWKEGSGDPFFSKDPFTGKVLWEGKDACKDEVDDAVSHAKIAFENWAFLPLEERKHFLLAFKAKLEENQQKLGETISQETGKPLWDSLGEVRSMIGKIDISIESFAKRCPETVKKMPAASVVTRHKPHGAIAVFGPFNFPGHLPNGHIIPALLAGNTIILKPSELTPLTAELIIGLWQSCNIPKGVINLVQGGRKTGQHLALNPLIDGLFFTGSYQTGLYLSRLFSENTGKILALEMGGNNPLLVMDVPDIKAAAYIAIQSAFLSSGQRCTCARRLIVLKGANGDAFIQALAAMVKNIRVGHYKDIPEPFMGPLINEEHALKILEMQSNLIQKKAIPLIEAKLLKKGTGLLSPGLIDVSPLSFREDAEIFGPLLQIIRVGNLEEGIREANHTSYGLSAGILTDKKPEYLQFYRGAKAGIINWNTPLTGASSSAPFGGIGNSGNLRPSAYYAADYSSYPVASMEEEVLKMPSTLTPGIKVDSDVLRI